MEITGIYSHKDGLSFIEKNRPKELEDIYNAVENIDFISALSKLSYEDTKQNPLFSPVNINSQLANYLLSKDWLERSDGKKGYVEKTVFWNRQTNRFEDKNDHNVENLTANKKSMDGLKNKVGLEIQMGKYSFMGYDIFVKLPIFAKENLIDCAIELVCMHSMIKNFSTGVGSFEQCVQEIKGRGESDLDIPTLVLGFECSKDEFKKLEQHKANFNKCLDESIANGDFKSLKELKTSSVKRESFIKKINDEHSLKINMGNKGASPGP